MQPALLTGCLWPAQSLGGVAQWQSRGLISPWSRVRLSPPPLCFITKAPAQHLKNWMRAAHRSTVEDVVPAPEAPRPQAAADMPARCQSHKTKGSRAPSPEATNRRETSGRICVNCTFDRGHYLADLYGQAGPHNVDLCGGSLPDAAHPANPLALTSTSRP